MATEFHTPVLLAEALAYLDIKEGEKYIDATLGGGGHAKEILARGGIVLGIDCDPEAIDYVRENYQVALKSEQLKIKRGNFLRIKELAAETGFGSVSGVLYDLGMSSYQLDRSGRGFSFKSSEELDMRMDPDLDVTAQDLVNGLTKNELVKLFRVYGEEQFAGRYASAIVRASRVERIKTAVQLAEIIEGVAPWRGRIHPATRVFQALRIAVNDELNNLRSSLPRALEILKSEGRLVVITFHSLEDKIVHQFMDSISDSEGVAYLTPKGIEPGREEIVENPRASSAKLRALKKL